MRWSHSAHVDTPAAKLIGWQQQYDRLSGGAFRGPLAEVWLDDVQVCRERIRHAVRPTCRIRPDTLWCGVPRAPDGTRIEGHRVGDAGEMVSGSKEAFELLTPDHHDIFGIVASRSALQAAACAQGRPLNMQMPHRPTWLACDLDAQAQLQRGLALRLVDAGHGESCHDHAAARRFAQAAVLDTLLSARAVPQADGHAGPSFERRRRLVQRSKSQAIESPA